jgi:hypothetical protein
MAPVHPLAGLVFESVNEAEREKAVPTVSVAVGEVKVAVVGEPAVTVNSELVAVKL